MPQICLSHKAFSESWSIIFPAALVLVFPSKQVLQWNVFAKTKVQNLVQANTKQLIFEVYTGWFCDSTLWTPHQKVTVSAGLDVWWAVFRTQTWQKALAMYLQTKIGFKKRINYSFSSCISEVSTITWGTFPYTDWMQENSGGTMYNAQCTNNSQPQTLSLARLIHTKAGLWRGIEAPRVINSVRWSSGCRYHLTKSHKL